MPTSLGPAEILVILVVALVVLGPKRLPEAGRHIGKFVREVRHWSETIQSEIRDVIDLEGEPAPPPPASSPPAAAAPAAAPPPVTTPADLSSSETPEAARRSAAAEWGLPEKVSPPPPPSEALPPEWETPSSSNGDHA